jgi:hypothetical protein
MFNVMQLVYKNGNKVRAEFKEPKSLCSQLANLTSEDWNEMKEASFFLQTTDKCECIATWVVYK